MELRITLAKLFYSFDLTLLDEDVDWHRDSRMHTLWNKPHLKVQAIK